MCFISLAFRLGEITLGDFKEAIDRPGMFRYHFKALDPEFGTVKEEVWGFVYTLYRALRKDFILQFIERLQLQTLPFLERQK